MQKNIYIKNNGAFYKAAISKVTQLMRGLYDENIFQTNLGTFVENTMSPQGFLFWNEEDVHQNRFCGHFDSRECFNSFNEFCAKKGLEWNAMYDNNVIGNVYYWDANIPVKKEIKKHFVGFEYDFDLETWFPIDSDHIRILPYCPKGCYRTAKECKDNNSPIFITEVEREDLRLKTYNEIVKKVKAEDGYVCLQHSVGVKVDGELIVIKAVTLKYSYETNLRPYCNLVAISSDFSNWDVDDYFSKRDMDRLLNEM